MSLFIPVANPLVSVDFRAKYPSSIILEKYKIEEQYQKLLDVQGNESIWRQYCSENDRERQYFVYYKSAMLADYQLNYNRLYIATQFAEIATQTLRKHRSQTKNQ